MKPPYVDWDKVLVCPIEPADADLISGFNCGDADLDDFLKTDALPFQDFKIAQTYLAIELTELPEGETRRRLIGYFSVAADAVRLTSGEKRKLRNESGQRMSNNKPPVIPSMKLARIAVCEAYKTEHCGCGTEMVRYACQLALEAAKQQGCRLLTVDAYPDAVEFYTKLKFVENKASQGSSSKPKPPRKTTSMRLDVFAPETSAFVTQEFAVVSDTQEQSDDS